jgi:hypothetical protein
MTSEGLGEMFEGDSADMCTSKFSLMLMRGRAEGLACADLGARTQIDVSGNYQLLTINFCLFLDAKKLLRLVMSVPLYLAMGKL